jgi:hypothetical protein
MVTLIVHGTFARDETWWRLDPAGNSFASKLDAALGRRGLQRTVWTPALDAGLDYAAFSWTGNNRHGDRRHGGRTLAAGLTRLATTLKATREAPLEVNLVAHSHGGNVVLEALRRLPPTVRARRVILLGTPLISARPVLRPLNIAFAVILGVLVAASVLGLFGKLLLPRATTEFTFLELLGAVVIVVAGYGWVFVGITAGVHWLLRQARAFVGWLTGQNAGQVYGPHPRALAKTVANGHITLFTTHDDEADLLLQLGAAPHTLYAAYVGERLRPITQVFEQILVRPLAWILVLDLLEALLERYVLGFRWLGILFVDYQMADLENGRAYPTSVVQRVDVSDQLMPQIQAAVAEAALPDRAPPVEPIAEKGEEERRRRTILERLDEVAKNLKAQIRLRHSVYYQNQEVIERVAETLAGP